MASSVDIRGREFDWFAQDRDGYTAVFATAGLGLVPLSVLAETQAHDSMSESIPVAGWGSSQVWDSCAAVGLYVYDWDDSMGCYLRVAVPATPLLTRADSALQSASLPVLAISFRSAIEVSPADLQDRT
jgi:hypothetical protein